MISDMNVEIYFNFICSKVRGKEKKNRMLGPATSSSRFLNKYYGIS